MRVDLDFATKSALGKRNYQLKVQATLPSSRSVWAGRATSLMPIATASVSAVLIFASS